jgi:hypothetical protein
MSSGRKGGDLQQFTSNFVQKHKNDEDYALAGSRFELEITLRKTSNLPTLFLHHSVASDDWSVI